MFIFQILKMQIIAVLLIELLKVKLLIKVKHDNKNKYEDQF